MELDTNRKKTEIEAKFICPDELSFNNLLDVLKTLSFQYTKEKSCLQTDVYFDTSDYSLLNSATALRIRKRGENYVGTCKSSKKHRDAIFECKEVEWDLSRDEIKLWNEEKKPTIPPGIIAELNLCGQTLRKVLVVETRRYATLVTGDDGFQVEFSLDEVTFRGHKGQKHYREIEVELLNGQLEQFKHVINSLQDHVKLQPTVDSKYKKGMMLVGKYGVTPPETSIYKNT